MTSAIAKAKHDDPEEFVARSIALRPTISERAEETETARRIPMDLVDEIRDGGFFRLLQPRRFGGLECDIATAMRCVIEWAAADCSTGWVCSLGVVHQWLIAQFPLPCQEEVWGGDPGTIACGSYAPAGECVPARGGYRVTGRYHFASGVDVTDWAIIGVFFPPEENGGEPVPGFAMVPKTEFGIEDDWRVMGLAGTGSKTVICENVYVPAHRRVTFADLASGNSPGYRALRSNLYRYPVLSLVAYGIATPALGCLKGALEDYLNAMNGRATRGALVLGGQRVRDFQAVQMRVGRAAANLKAARAMLFEQLELSRAKVIDRNGLLTVADRLENRITQAKMVEMSVEGVEQLFGAVGGQGLHSSHRVQRAWRDAHAIAHHVSFNWDALSAMYGQHLMGLEPQGQY